MLIAEAKKKENIIEYLLYMFQVEDIIRAVSYNEEMYQSLASEMAPNDINTSKTIVQWYNDIADEMKQLELEKRGHISRITETIVELFYLHSTLLTTYEDPKYKEIYEKALPNINLFREKSGGVTNEIQLCLNGLYGKMILHLKKQKISKVTDEAMDSFRDVLAYLGMTYKLMKSGELNALFN